MGYALLWLEALVAALLFVATVAACAAQLQRRGMQLALWVVGALPPLLLFATLSVGAGFLKYQGVLVDSLFYGLLALAICFTAGVIWIRLAGLRLLGEGLARPVASGWSRGKLAVATVVAVILCMMTYWNMDAVVGQQAAALRAESGSLALSVAPDRVPDRQNAAIIYGQAFETLGDYKTWPKKQREDWNKWTQFGSRQSNEKPEPFDPTDPALGKFLEDKASVVALLHRAAALPGCYFDHEYGRPSFDMLLPELSQLRSMARLLALDARAKAARSDGAGAVADLNAIFAMAEHCSRAPLLISLLVAIAIDNLGTDSLEAVLAAGNLTAEDLAALHVSDTIQYGRLFKRALIMEEAFGLSVFHEMAGGLDTNAFALTGSDLSIPKGFGTLYGIFLLRDDVASYRRFLKQYQDMAAEPYYLRKNRWESSADLLKENRGIVTTLIAPALSSCAETATRADARHRLARLGLAISRYRAEHEDWPSELGALTPEYIIALPLDPFDGQPLRLKQTDSGPIVYSIGPDGQDDGAQTFDKKQKTGDLTLQLSGQ